jgi:hypothetical protein
MEISESYKLSAFPQYRHHGVHQPFLQIIAECRPGESADNAVDGVDSRSIADRAHILDGVLNEMNVWVSRSKLLRERFVSLDGKKTTVLIQTLQNVRRERTGARPILENGTSRSQVRPFDHDFRKLA